jgi:type I restriction enzyme M protein
MWDGQVWGIHELFRELPVDPAQAEIQVRNSASAALWELVKCYFAPLAQPIWQKRKDTHATSTPLSEEAAHAEWEKAIKTPLQEFNRAVRDVQQRFFESEDGLALPLWKWIVQDCLKNGLETYKYHITHALDTRFPDYEPLVDLKAALEDIAREVAKLDGFGVTLRSLAVDQATDLKAAKHWVVPVRAWARNDEWQSEDGLFIGSHDADSLVRPAYVETMLAASLYDEKGSLKDGLLDPDCIEGRDWNLSAGQYKPFDFTQLKSDKSVSQLIGELKFTEQQIIGGLDKLLAMVEGRE